MSAGAPILLARALICSVAVALACAGVAGAQAPAYLSQPPTQGALYRDGQTGRYRDRPGFASAGEALSGLRHINGYPGQAPPRFGISLGDTLAAQSAFQGILLALYARDVRGATGQVVDASITDACLAITESAVLEYEKTGTVRNPTGTRLPRIAPSNVYRSSDDKWVVIAANHDTLWRRFAPLLGLPELVHDPRFATNPDRVVHRAELIPLIEEALAARGSAAWAEELSRAGIPAGAINTVDQALAHPQVVARDMVLTTEHPTAGTLRMPGSPLKLSRHSTSVRRPPPLLGEHTDDVLRELGYSPDDIGALHRDGVVR